LIHHKDTKNSKGLDFVSFMPLWLKIDRAERVRDDALHLEASITLFASIRG